MVECALGLLEGGYSGLVNIWGTPGATGSLAFRSRVTSGATEPSPDPSANAATTAVKVYGIPRATITRVDAPVAKGRRGALSGQAVRGAAFEPALERVTKVEIAMLRQPLRASAATSEPCLWLNNAGGFTKVPQHRGSCDKGVWLKAKGTATWKYALKKGLPKGTYTLLVRGTNAAGLTGRQFSSQKKNAVLVSVK
jgi:hypothetical protein